MPLATSSIAALAFNHLELKPFASLADDRDEVIAANDLYPLALRSVLEAGDFSFASKMAVLARQTAETLDETLTAGFTLPDDFLRLQQVWPEGARYRIDGRAFLSDEDSITIRYSAIITNEDLMSAKAREAVALHLAALMAPRWLENRAKINDLRVMAEEAVTAALRVDRFSASPERYQDGTDVDWATEATW